MKVVSCSRKAMLYYVGQEVDSKDVIRKKRCDWCATEILTVEKQVCMLTPPKKDRIKDLGRTAQQDSVWRSRD